MRLFTYTLLSSATQILCVLAATVIGGLNGAAYMGTALALIAPFFMFSLYGLRVNVLTTEHNEYPNESTFFAHRIFSLLLFSLVVLVIWWAFYRYIDFIPYLVLIRVLDGLTELRVTFSIKSAKQQKVLEKAVLSQLFSLMFVLLAFFVNISSTYQIVLLWFFSRLAAFVILESTSIRKELDFASFNFNSILQIYTSGAIVAAGVLVNTGFSSLPRLVAEKILSVPDVGKLTLVMVAVGASSVFINSLLHSNVNLVRELILNRNLALLKVKIERLSAIFTRLRLAIAFVVIFFIIFVFQERLFAILADLDLGIVIAMTSLVFVNILFCTIFLLANCTLAPKQVLNLGILNLIICSILVLVSSISFGLYGCFIAIMASLLTYSFSVGYKVLNENQKK